MREIAPSTASKRTAQALIWVIPILFASNNIAARLAQDVVSPVALAFWRWAIPCAFLLALVGKPLLDRMAVLRTEWKRIVLLGLLGMAVASLGTYIGAHSTTAGNIGLIYASTPGLILLLDRVLTGTRLSRSQVLGMIACISGMIYIVMRGDLAALVAVDFNPGDLWAAAGALGWAAYSVFLKYWPTQLTMWERAAATSLAGAALLLPLYIGEAVLFSPPPFSLDALILILIVGVFAGLLVLLLHAHITQVLGSRRAVTLLYLIPLYNLALAWPILGEPLHLYQATGAALVLGGIYLSSNAQRSPAASSSPSAKSR